MSTTAPTGAPSPEHAGCVVSTTPAPGPDSAASIAQQVRALVEQNPRGISRDAMLEVIDGLPATITAAISKAKVNGTIVEVSDQVYGWPSALAQAYTRDDDGHAVRVRPGRLAGDLGLLLEDARGGRAFVPAHALPDLRRRLLNFQHQLQKIPPGPR